MDGFIAFVRKVAKFLDYIAAVVLFGNCVLVVLNVITRSPIFKYPIFGVYEMVCYFSLVSVSFAISNCSFAGGHTNMTFLLEKIPASKRKLIEAVVEGISLINFLLITWNLMAYMISRFRIGEVTPVMRIPLHIIVGFLVIGFIPLTLAPLAGLLEKVKRIRSAS